nr:hypothetical protein [Tanacetum cinerariifolium]
MLFLYVPLSNLKAEPSKSDLVILSFLRRFLASFVESTVEPIKSSKIEVSRLGATSSCDCSSTFTTLSAIGSSVSIAALCIVSPAFIFLSVVGGWDGALPFYEDPTVSLSF